MPPPRPHLRATPARWSRWTAFPTRRTSASLHLISEVANLEKKVPLEWVNADHTAMTDEFLAYALPLVQAELTPIYVEGLPHHIYLPEA